VNEINGFIKLYRSVLDWEWFNDISTFRLFIYCLLKANYSDTKWRGIDIEKGSFITSYNRLSLQTGLTLQQVRTSLNKLVITGELTHIAHSKYSVIKVNNYEVYQESNKQKNKQSNNQITSNQQGSNKVVTTDKEEKKETKEEQKNIYLDRVRLTKLEYNKLLDDFGQLVLDEFIFRLDEYLGMTGKVYKNHSMVIRNWIRKDPKPTWLGELKHEQEIHDNKIYEVKRSPEEIKRKLDEL
jgi:hypothetical protein